MNAPARTIHALRTRHTNRGLYPRLRDRLVRDYDALLRRCPGAPLPFRKRCVRVRLDGHDRPLTARLGSSDFVLFEQVLDSGEYDAVRELDPVIVRVVLDLGSNIGLTLRLWRSWFPEAQVVGVEPDESNLDLCRANADSGDGRVALIRACVAASNRTVYLDRSRLEWTFAMSDRSDAGVPVEGLTVPDLLARASVGADAPIDLLKCDVEGAEREVFGNCQAWISRVRNLVVEVHGGYQVKHLEHDLSAAGWSWSESHVLRKGHDFSVAWLRQA